MLNERVLSRRYRYGNIVDFLVVNSTDSTLKSRPNARRDYVNKLNCKYYFGRSGFLSVGPSSASHTTSLTCYKTS